MKADPSDPMSLQKCPECKVKILSTSSYCDHCGARVKEDFARFQPKFDSVYGY